MITAPRVLRIHKASDLCHKLLVNFIFPFREERLVFWSHLPTVSRWHNGLSELRKLLLELWLVLGQKACWFSFPNLPKKNSPQDEPENSQISNSILLRPHLFFNMLFWVTLYMYMCDHFSTLITLLGYKYKQ